MKDLDLDIFEGVSSLSNKSLIRQMEEANGESRLRMLETIREFAAARLDEDTEFQCGCAAGPRDLFRRVYPVSTGAFDRRRSARRLCENWLLTSKIFRLPGDIGLPKGILNSLASSPIAC